MEQKTIDLFVRIFSVLKPPLPLTISEWADQHRRLSQESTSQSGRWRTSVAPYQKEIMDAITDRQVKKVVIMSAAQIGKTDAFILNPAGYFIHHDPAPIMIMQPTLQMGEAFSKDRLSPMIRDTPVLAELIREQSRTSGNTIMHKKFPGGQLTIVGANSPASLASRPICILLADEIDRFPAAAGNEGDPLLLAAKRTDTFWNKKEVDSSTPTIDGLSRIQVEYKYSTQEEWNLPCPECGALNPLDWELIHFDSNDLDKGIFHGCSSCGVLSTEQAWKAQSIKGEYVAKYPERKVRGFHLNSLASPWKPWREIVEEFLTAKREADQGNVELLKVWTNTTLGQVWQEKGDEIEYEQLLARRENYDCEVPQNVLVLTAGVDVQDNRLEAEVVGWGPGKESYGILYTKFYGNPGDQDVWDRLDAFLARIYTREDGRKLEVSCACIDTGGHFTNEVYKFCKDKALRRIFAIKGGNRAGIPFIGKPSAGNRYKTPLFIIGVATGKELLLDRLKVEKSGGGYCHFPLEEQQGYDEAYFKGLTAEKRVIRYSKGRPRFEWILKRKGMRNEPLDLRVYATAALEIYNPTLESDMPELPEKPTLPARKRGVVKKGL